MKTSSQLFRTRWHFWVVTPDILKKEQEETPFTHIAGYCKLMHIYNKMLQEA
jgi:hypothetical protein